ncbi:MAG: inorganic phosphate transporter [Succinivibrionaceae bacterium]|nr:inorganic phosphate transporter [Succinivibrionaceae bacterium]
MELLIEHGTLLIVIATSLGFLMAWGIGANDVANAMSTSVGTKSLTVVQALAIAAVFEFLGAYLAGGQVTNTIKEGIVDTEAFGDNGIDLTLGMISAMFAAGTWLILASILGWPVSTTHTIIGAIIGFSLLSVGADAIHWGMLWGIFGSWIITPVISGVIAYLLFVSVLRGIFRHFHPMKHAKRKAPLYIALTVFVISSITVSSGLQHIGFHDITTGTSFLISGALALAAAAAGAVVIRRIPEKNPNSEKDGEKERKKGKSRNNYKQVEKIFSVLMIITACAMAFAHGSNDVANSIGPLSAVVSAVNHARDSSYDPSALEWWILPLGAVGIVIGLSTLGYKVMKTVGVKITHLTPSRGFAAQLATAATVVIASGTGLPISTTQTLVGAIIGIGLAHGIAAINLRVISGIFASWIITLPSGTILSIIFFKILQFFFS